MTNKKAIDWMMGGDTGISSKAIWAVMMGATRAHHADPPSDCHDFGRCYRLLALIPAWRARFAEMDALPAWRPFVRDWAKLEAMYEAAPLSKYGSKWSDEMYRHMKVLGDESLIADGWVVDGRNSAGEPCGWKRADGGEGSIFCINKTTAADMRKNIDAELKRRRSEKRRSGKSGGVR